MYKGIIFDLDGTIADTLKSIAVSANRVLKECGLEPRPIDEYRYYAGDGADTLIRRSLSAAGDLDGVNFNRAYKKYGEIFEKDCTFEVKVFDGMMEALKQIKGKGIKLGVLTNKPHDRAVTVVGVLFGNEIFDIVIGQQEGLAKKPDPTGAILMAEKLGIDPRDCMYVGDTDVDMETGKRAGMYTVGVLWGFREKQELLDHKADVLIERPGELLGLL